MTRCLSRAMAITVSEDMNTATQGNVLTNLHSRMLSGMLQDMLTPSITVQGIEADINRSDMARLNTKMLRAVLLAFLLEQFRM